MESRPRVLFDRSLQSIPKVSLILLDWSCRESLHILDYLAKQDVPREWFEVLWIEYFDLAAPEIARRIEDAARRGDPPPVDRWISLNMPRTAYYHKHLMYNLGILASRGALVMIGDSDAMVTPGFVRTLVEAFEQDPGIVLHLDEVRSHNRSFYPFNYPSFEAVVGDDCINWRDGRTTGLLEEFDPLHTRNYGACICARRDDVVAIGGADEHPDYLGHICGPYDMTWRLVNLGRREVWHPTEFLYHVWHPGTDGDENYMGPHDGQQISTIALQTRRNGRVMPLVHNPVIRELREGHLAERPLAETLAEAIGDRPFTEWVIDDVKRAVSAGRSSWAQHRHADALATWEPVLTIMSGHAQFLSDLGWAHYFVGAHQAAVDAFDRSLALDEDNPDAWRGRGWALTNSGRSSLAIASFTRAIALADPLLRTPMQEAYRGRGWSYLHEKQLQRAHEDFSTGLTLTPPGDVSSRQDLIRGLGWLAIKQERWHDAHHHFTEATHTLGERRGPEYDDARSGLSRADDALRSALGRTVRGALPPLRATVGNPTNTAPERRSRGRVRSRLATDLAAAYFDAQRYDDALRLFQEAYAIDSSNLRSAIGAGWTALRLDRLQQANAIFKQVVRLPWVDPAIARDAFHGLGWVAYREGRVNHALKEFLRAMRITDPPPTPATLAEIKMGVRRARYLAGTGNVTLADIARHEKRSVLHVLLHLQGRTLQNRITSLFGRGRLR
jgi:tetratricopeptide (TPR) repeat protein